MRCRPSMDRPSARSYSKPHRPGIPRWRSRSPTPAPAFPKTSWQACSTPSSRPSRRARASGCRSCAPSSKPMAARYRPTTRPAAAPSSASPSRSIPARRADCMDPVIHVVDDDAAVRTALARLLHASGYCAVLYESGSAFLERPPPAERGCILLDLRMPGASGLQVQARLLELGCVLPIVFLTSHGDIPTSVRAIKNGAEDFLCKPATRRTLCDAIERALRRYDEQRREHDRMSAMSARVAE